MSGKKRRVNKKPTSKDVLRDILKGNILYRDEVRKNYKFILLVFLLIMIMIYSNHLVNQRIGQVNVLKHQVEEYKSQNAYTQSKLIKIRLESELSKEMERDSLKSLEMHPLKILVKLDSTDYDKVK